MKNEDRKTYGAENIHDFNLFTAWILKKAIGAKINFYFKPFGPRVNEIKIWNGYIKNVDLWKANSRVAKFKLSVNGVPTAILALKDVNNTQSFKITPVHSVNHSKDLVLTLEILEIYQGRKYDEAAISEINFDGLDVHCFGAGTQITPADNNKKDIEFIAKGDWIATFDRSTDKIVKAQVSKLVTAKHANLFKLHFSDREIIVTDDHPFLTAGKVWASINPTKSNTNYEQDSEVTKLNVGDKLFLAQDGSFAELMSIEKVEGAALTYTIELTNGDNFIANGFSVKTEKPKRSN